MCGVDAVALVVSLFAYLVGCGIGIMLFFMFADAIESAVYCIRNFLDDLFSNED